jgi:hypothetical protein
MATVLIVFGLLALIMGLLTMAQARNDLARRRRVLATPTSRIADAKGGGCVEIAGRLVVGERGTVTAPFSGREGVFVRVIVEEYRQEGKSGHWETIFSESQSRDFYVEDGSGERARIDPSGANVVLDREKIASSGTLHDPPPALETFLAVHGMSSTGWLGLNKSLRYEEEVLAVGDAVYALGPSVREAGPPVQNGYRNGSSTVLTLSAMGDADGELLLSNKSESQLVAKLRRSFVVGAVAAAGGLVLVLLAFVVWRSAGPS